MTSAAVLADLPLLARRTLGETVYAALSELLASGQLGPGERLSLRDSAAALGVSVMPVREAVNRLVAEQALEVTPGRAIRVPLMSRSEFEALAETRMAVEGLAAARAATHRSAEALAAIRGAEGAFRRMAEERVPDRVRLVALNRDVHFTIYRAAALLPLQEIIARLWLKAGPVLNLDLREHPERVRQGSALRRHAEALAAIEAGDGAGASAAIAADIRDAADFIIAHGRLPEG